MNKLFLSPVQNPDERHTGFILLFFAVLLVIKTLFISAAYPIFSPVDEAEHYDVIHKYARGHFPQKNELFDKEVYLLLVVKSTKEYILDEAALRKDTRDYFGRIADFPEDQKALIAEKNDIISGEGGQAPIYYLLLAAVKRLAERAGFHEEGLVYSLRFCNALILLLLLYTAFFFVKTFYPGNRFLALAVPLAITCMPQDAFFQIGNDVLSPLVFLAACYFLFKILCGHPLSLFHFVLAGTATALAFLTKYSNAPVFFLYTLALYASIRKAARGNYRRQDITALVAFVLFALIPVCLWTMRNYAVFGDYSGFAQKVRMLGWVDKPPSQWLIHPFFYTNGIFIFFRDLIVKYWRGELVWHSRPIHSAALDTFYVFSSILFVGLAAVSSHSSKEKRVDNLLFLTVALFVSQLLYLSVVFDFGGCHYPSKEYPYFTSGRLILGGLVPFLILYLKGFQYLAAKISVKKTAHQMILFSAVILFIAVAEYTIALPVFKSQRNWFFYRAFEKTAIDR